MGMAKSYGKFLLLEADFGGGFGAKKSTMTLFKNFIKESRNSNSWKGNFNLIDTYFNYINDFNCGFELYETKDSKYYAVVFYVYFNHHHTFSQKNLNMVLFSEDYFDLNKIDPFNVFKHLLSKVNYKKINNDGIACSKKLLFKKENFYNYKEFIYLLHELLKIYANFIRKSFSIIGFFTFFSDPILNINNYIDNVIYLRVKNLKALLNSSVNNMMLYLIEASMEYQMHERDVIFNNKGKQISTEK